MTTEQKLKDVRVCDFCGTDSCVLNKCIRCGKDVCLECEKVEGVQFENAVNAWYCNHCNTLITTALYSESDSNTARRFHRAIRRLKVIHAVNEDNRRQMVKKETELARTVTELFQDWKEEQSNAKATKAGS